MRRLFFFVLLLATGYWLLATSAFAASCGGATACACGDDVIASTTLTGNLTCGTTSHGLNVAADGVTIDCATFTISRSSAWTNGSTERYGIHVNGYDGTLIKNCTIGSGWRNGVRIKAATGATIQTSTVSSNGDSTAHVGYGVEITQGSTGITLDTVTVQSNADEGIHISDGSIATIIDNTVTNNFREQLYLLGATVSVDGGTYGGTGTVAFYVKDSSDSTFVDVTADKQVRVIGASSNNVFTNLTMTGGVRVDYYKPTTGAISFPTDNSFVSGTLSASSDCIRLDSSTDTTFDGVTLGSCTGGFPINADATYGDCSVTLANMTQPDLSGATDCTVSIAQDWTVHVQDGGAADVPDATVQIYNRFAEPIAEFATDANGDVEFPAVVVSVGKNSLSKTTPHWLAVSKDAYADNKQRVTVGPNQNTTVTLTHD